eukprot:13545148-Alexandrium_andersonii.AAC.1
MDIFKTPHAKEVVRAGVRLQGVQELLDDMFKWLNYKGADTEAFDKMKQWVNAQIEVVVLAKERVDLD